MNILMLHGSAGLYGASKIMLQVIDVCLQDGHQVIVVLPEDGLLVDELKKRGVKVNIFPLGVLRRQYFNIAGLFNRFSALTNAYFKIAKILRAEQIDLVYSNTSAVMIGAAVAKIKGVKHIWHLHELIESPKILAKFIGWALKSFSDRTIAVSNAVRNYWNQVNPEQPDKILLIHNGIEGEKFQEGNRKKIRQELALKDNELLLGMVGRVHKMKNQSYFLDVAHEIAKNASNIKYLMVGDVYPGQEYLYEEINQQIEALGLNEDIIQLKFRRDINDIMAAMDVFILPSVWDPFPTVILEAMHAKRTVVATKQGGAVEMLEENAGILIPLGHPQQAAEQILPLLQNKELRTELSLNGYKRVNEVFTIEQFNKNWSALLKSL
mgnify:CR=1 FL=1